MGGFRSLGVQGEVIYILRFHNEESEAGAHLYIIYQCLVVTCTRSLSPEVTEQKPMTEL